MKVKILKNTMAKGRIYLTGEVVDLKKNDPLLDTLIDGEFAEEAVEPKPAEAGGEKQEPTA